MVFSSFYDRYSTELARMFRAVLRELMTNLAANEGRYGDVLEGLRDVLVADATVVKLHRLLARRFPGTRKNSSPAAAKLHLVMSASGTGAHKVKVTGERTNDHRTLQMGPWVEGRLLLFDLGYFRYQLFDAIDGTSIRGCWGSGWHGWQELTARQASPVTICFRIFWEWIQAACTE